MYQKSKFAYKKYCAPKKRFPGKIANFPTTSVVALPLPKYLPVHNCIGHGHFKVGSATANHIKNILFRSPPLIIFLFFRRLCNTKEATKPSRPTASSTELLADSFWHTLGTCCIQWSIRILRLGIPCTHCSDLCTLLSAV
jgi:hypothetical protein